jgi:hypothetical protein
MRVLPLQRLHADQDAAGDYIAGAVNDRNGELDIDGDGKPNEINMGCETCHGPGSVHDKAKEIDMPATIVSPNKLAAERADVLCGQCHSRPQGNLKNDQPVNKDNKMMLPGTSRNTLPHGIHHPTGCGKEADFWADGLHSKSHHQQYSDFIKSSKQYRNGNQLVACSDCHDTHGNGKFPHQMKARYQHEAEVCTSLPQEPHRHEGAPCGQGQVHRGRDQDHLFRLPQHQDHADRRRLRQGPDNKDGKNYWLNDITSHVYDVPRKDNKGVKGVEPGKAMPIPYTNKCGAACHDTKNL